MTLANLHANRYQSYERLRYKSEELQSSVECIEKEAELSCQFLLTRSLDLPSLILLYNTCVMVLLEQGDSKSTYRPQSSLQAHQSSALLVTPWR